MKSKKYKLQRKSAASTTSTASTTSPTSTTRTTKKAAKQVLPYGYFNQSGEKYNSLKTIEKSYQAAKNSNKKQTKVVNNTYGIIVNWLCHLLQISSESHHSRHSWRYQNSTPLNAPRTEFSTIGS
ncbi:hypothetical protein DFA_10556 [Cavenderia fasciculata]|uniref:Uncharacterized protein n=1 Tax=Cavenderia fasciculata TaxID=261658 RepID=F4QAJ5_CACFS|nr:uncharacterized protein DFA_10556 [Cavenderia fasciculata]EGG15714.1 hypothetical protein DFA_10556 [Cavenderia fasciculata]|eukprot:XP_004354456.1 hypothetical protein DFA_10556 [Cavenderia fasciculata]